MNPPAIDCVLFNVRFTVAGITFQATIEANFTALLTVKGSGSTCITSNDLTVAWYNNRSSLQYSLLAVWAPAAATVACRYILRHCILAMHHCMHLDSCYVSLCCLCLLGSDPQKCCRHLGVIC